MVRQMGRHLDEFRHTFANAYTSRRGHQADEQPDESAQPPYRSRVAALVAPVSTTSP